MQLWFYATPIIYPISVISGSHPSVVKYYRLNPIERFTEVFRNTMYDGRWPSLANTGYVVAWAVVALVLGYAVFNRYEGRLAEELRPGRRGQGHDVVVLDDLSTGFRSNLEGLDAELIVGSILDVDLVDKAASGAQSIVHLAAQCSVPLSVADPEPTNLVNVSAALFNVLQAARREKAHVIVASSSAVYGAQTLHCPSMRV